MVKSLYAFAVIGNTEKATTCMSASALKSAVGLLTSFYRAVCTQRSPPTLRTWVSSPCNCMQPPACHLTQQGHWRLSDIFGTTWTKNNKSKSEIANHTVAGSCPVKVTINSPCMYLPVLWTRVRKCYSQAEMKNQFPSSFWSASQWEVLTCRFQAGQLPLSSECPSGTRPPQNLDI